MTLALAGARRDAGVSIAEVNLKLIWDVISQIKVGANGRAYVVDAQGRLIAHPDISLVLRNIDMSQLPQVRAALAGAASGTEPFAEAKDLQGGEVLTAYASVKPLGWFVFVELPAGEAYGPLYAGGSAARDRSVGGAHLRSACRHAAGAAHGAGRSRRCRWAPRASAAAISRSASR